MADGNKAEKQNQESFPGSTLAREAGTSTEDQEQRADKSMGSEFNDQEARNSVSENDDCGPFSCDESSDISHVDVDSDPEDATRH